MGDNQDGQVLTKTCSQFYQQARSEQESNIKELETKLH